MIEGASLRLVVSLTRANQRRMRPLRDRILKKQRFANGEKTRQASAESVSVTDPDELACAASELLTMRRRRNAILPVSDAAWELLLTAFASYPNVVQTKEFCAGSPLPEATVIRWIQFLEGQGLLEKAAHPIRRDQRATYYRPTAAGCAKVGHALTAMLQG